MLYIYIYIYILSIIVQFIAEILLITIITVIGIICQKRAFDRKVTHHGIEEVNGFKVGILALVFAIILPIVLCLEIHSNIVNDEKKLVIWNSTRRLGVPIIIGAILFLGLILHTIVAFSIDDKTVINLYDRVLLLGKVWILTITTTLKAWFSSIFSTILLVTITYFWFEYGVFKTWYFFEVFFNWVFASMPSGVENTYKICLAIVMFLSAFLDSMQIEF